MQSGDIKKEISAWIKHIRKIKGDITQEELGEKVGIHKQQIHLYEKGLRHPRPRQINKIAEYGGIPLDLFIAESGLYETKLETDKNILSLIREVLNSGDEKDIDFLIDHLRAQLKMIQARKGKNEKKGSD